MICSNVVPARHFGRKTGIEQLAVAAVAEDEPILAVVESESLGDALDGIDEPLARFGHLAQILFLDLDRGVPEEPERLGHAADFVAARGRQRRAKIAAGDCEHALAHPAQTGEKAAVDVEPDDQNRTQEAEKGGAEDNSGAVALDDRGLETGRGDLAVRRGDQAIDGGGETARQLIVLGQKLLALRQDCELVLARLRDAVSHRRSAP